MIRIIPISKERHDRMVSMKQSAVTITSFFPVDPPGCPCIPLIEEAKTKLALMNQKDRDNWLEATDKFNCPKPKKGTTRYKIVCNNCGQVQGVLWSKDKSLTDWQDFHYVQWHDKTRWYGCFTPHVSPISGKLCLECTCGQDTRDFRANMTLSGKLVAQIEESNSIGREFNTPGSKFSVIKA